VSLQSILVELRTRCARAVPWRCGRQFMGERLR